MSRESKEKIVADIAKTLAEYDGLWTVDDEDKQAGYNAEAEKIYKKYIAPERTNGSMCFSLFVLMSLLCIVIFLSGTTMIEKGHKDKLAVMQGDYEALHKKYVRVSEMRDEFALEVDVLKKQMRAIGEDYAATCSMAPLPLGLANNNPLNIKGTNWAGQIGTDKQGHAIFSHPYYGLRAGARLIKNYQKRHNIKTVQAIVQRWVHDEPQRDGTRARTKESTKKYVNFLARRIGVNPTQEIDVLAHMPWIIEGMVLYECGQQPYPPATFALLGVHADM